jgi:hypothetical protein
VPAHADGLGAPLAAILLNLRDDDRARLAATLNRCVDSLNAVRKALGVEPEG